MFRTLFINRKVKRINLSFGGEGGLVKDPHFFSGTLDHWKKSTNSGDDEGTAIVTDSLGYQNLQFKGPNGGEVSQEINGLKPGMTYSASVWVEVTGKQKATIGVKEVSNWTDSSPAVQYTASNPRRHQMKVLFTVPEDSKGDQATLYLQAAEGNADSKVEFADVRLVENKGANLQKDGHYYAEDFELVDQGWGPFVYAQDTGDPRIHLSGLHEGYTRDTISGKRSLKILDPDKGMQVRTLPQTIRFKPNHTHRVRFDYQSDMTDSFSFVAQPDGDGPTVVNDKLAQTTDRSLDSKPAANGEMPVYYHRKHQPHI